MLCFYMGVWLNLSVAVKKIFLFAFAKNSVSFVVTFFTNVLQIRMIERYVRVAYVRRCKLLDMVHYVAELLMTDLAQSAVSKYAFCYE